MDTARRGAALVMALALGVAACQGDDEAEAPTERQVLQLGSEAGDVTTLDPHQAATTADRTVVDMVFNGLVRFRPGDSSQIEPDLAVEVPEPETRGDEQVWRFDLREGVMCHAGPETESYELTADDVVYSLERSADSDRSAYAGAYEGISVEKVDDHAVEIVLDEPISPAVFLPLMANYAGGYIVCAEAVEAVGDEEFATHPVGTGPFAFSLYAPGDHVMLDAFDDYWRGTPELAGVQVRYMPDDSSRELALTRGDVHVVRGVPDSAWVESLDAQDGVTVDIFGVGEAVFVNFDVTVEPLDDERVRQALMYAIDRNEHVALFGEPVAEPIYSLVPDQLLPGGLSEEEVTAEGLDYAADPERARTLLEEAGYPDGFNLELITSEVADYRRNYEAMQSELDEVGVDIDLRVVDHTTMHTRIRERSNPIVIYVAWRPTAHDFLERFAHSSTRVEVGAAPDTNFAQYTGIDDLIDAAKVEPEPAESEELWKQANMRLLEDAAIYPLMFLNQVYGRLDTVDYGHELESVMDLYPGITEMTTIGS